MLELMTEILVYLAIAALIGILLGYLFWGWGRRAKIEAARAEAISGVRTSVDGDSSLKTQLEESERQRKRLELSLDRSKEKITALEAELRAQDLPIANVVEDPTAEIESTEEVVEDALAADMTEILDAEIEPIVEDAEPEPARRPLFATDRDVDPRISGYDPNEGQAPEPEVVPVLAPEPEALAQPAEAEPAPIPASLLTERPQEVDDLKTIKGVGVVMEGVLNDKGVYLFHQIANFSSADVAWVNEAIEAFPGRIERDNWVGQAQDLYRAKYGRSHDDP